MNKEREALKLALNALEKYQTKRQDFDRFADEITEIKEALAKPDPTPEQLAALGWQSIECPFCGTSGAQAFPKPEMQDWEGIAADQAMTIALMKSEQEPWCWRIDASNHSYFGETAELEARHEAKRIGGTCQAFPLYTAPSTALTAPTGWDNGLSQDYDKKLGAWFSEKPNAKEELRARTFDNYGIKELNT